MVAFTPGLDAADPVGSHWLLQVSLRLRREICWRWHLRDESPPHAGALPAPANPMMVSLDLARHADAKREFFRTDVTARYLSEQMATPAPAADDALRGSFGWITRELVLRPVDAFALALAVSATVDGAVGPVVAACLDDALRTIPTLGLLQRLWEDPAGASALADASHTLWRHGLMQRSVSGSPDTAMDWNTPLVSPPLVARHLLFSSAAAHEALEPIRHGALNGRGADVPEHMRPVVARLRSADARQLRVVPMLGPRHAAFADAAAHVAALMGDGVRAVSMSLHGIDASTQLRSVAVLAWLSGHHLMLRDASGMARAEELQLVLASLRGIPIVVYLPLSDPSILSALPRDLLLPMLVVPALEHEERVSLWRQALGARGAARDGVLGECARRFRYERDSILTIARALRADRAPLTPARLYAACRAEIPVDMGHLAQPVTPRFQPDDLVLPPGQRVQFDEIARAMRSLTEVHFGWGTGRAWNESGISVLFAGPPGTGKTMAAEVLAASLDMPMYRIDLSQVVNKYIGETEKNLKRLFDTADTTDAILFFDECDALFGRRTEVRDAHDRYANVEISYLLERMERFKGLAILATNRRKDIDEAFLRRLRYVVEFPMPDERERRALWMSMMPASVTVDDVDVDLLARQFPLAGGHIRSIILNACLQSTDRRSVGRKRPRLTMDRIMVAVRREYDKLGRSVTVEQFGVHAAVVERLAHV